MYVITYSLRENQLNSDHYYNDIAAFTDEVLAKAGELLDPVIKSYLEYSGNKVQENSVSYEESVLELLLLGTLWRVYGGDAMGIDNAPRYMLAMLAEMRRHNGNLKPGIDFLRGIMSTLFLSPDLYDNMLLIAPSMENLDKLLLWLESTGEFTQEAKRLRKWQDYLAILAGKESTDIIASAITVSLWFENCSEERLGGYTENVERYLNEVRPGRYWHEDVIFCGRRRVEYHLNMVGAEIMNRAFRESFLKTSRKVLLLPECMRLLPNLKCRAVLSGKGNGCLRCSTECQVGQLTGFGEKHNFDVIIVPHESSISTGSGKGSLFDLDTGVVGVACVLNLISGGWMLKEAGVPAQCVLLDYCGCKNHWHNEGIPTSINIHKLKQIIGWI